MADAFIECGYNLVSGGTDNHLMLIDLRNKGITGKEAEAALQAAEITVNKNMVPFDDKSPFVTSGIRIGTPAMTTRGFGKGEFKAVVNLIDRVLSAPENETVLATVRGEVHALCQQFPLYNFVVA
jgi:glycine hydroxymethyltransferase